MRLVLRVFGFEVISIGAEDSEEFGIASLGSLAELFTGESDEECEELEELEFGFTKT